VVMAFSDGTEEWMAQLWGGTWMRWPVYPALGIRHYFSVRIKPGIPRYCPRHASESRVNRCLEVISH